MPAGAAEKDRARTIVVIEWVFFTLSVIAVAVILFAFKDALFKTTNTGTGYSDNDNDNTYTYTYKYRDSSRDQTNLQLIVFSVIGVALLIAAAINITLTVGVHKEHSTCCRVWWVINIIGIVFQSLGVLGNLVTLNLLGIPISIAILCYRIYAGKIIKAYLDTLTCAGGIVYNTPHPHPYMPPTVNQGELIYPPPYNKLEQNC
jgi:hypothetical protein